MVSTTLVLPSGQVGAQPAGVKWAPATTSPPQQYGNSLAYDAATQQLVLFGGYGTNGTTLGDTWTWDGTTWTQANPATSPSARDGASEAYDSGKSDLVLFGGQDASHTDVNDTWTWDGTTWTQANPATSPPARSSAALAENGNGQVVLFGGVANDGTLPRRHLDLGWHDVDPGQPGDEPVGPGLHVDDLRLRGQL